jgi:hypothetical protein
VSCACPLCVAPFASRGGGQRRRRRGKRPAPIVVGLAAQPLSPSLSLASRADQVLVACLFEAPHAHAAAHCLSMPSVSFGAADVVSPCFSPPPRFSLFSFSAVAPGTHRRRLSAGRRSSSSSPAPLLVLTSLVSRPTPTNSPRAPSQICRTASPSRSATCASRLKSRFAGAPRAEHLVRLALFWPSLLLGGGSGGRRTCGTMQRASARADA